MNLAQPQWVPEPAESEPRLTPEQRSLLRHALKNFAIAVSESARKALRLPEDQRGDTARYHILDEPWCALYSNAALASIKNLSPAFASKMLELGQEFFDRGHFASQWYLCLSATAHETLLKSVVAHPSAASVFREQPDEPRGRTPDDEFYDTNRSEPAATSDDIDLINAQLRETEDPKPQSSGTESKSAELLARMSNHELLAYSRGVALTFKANSLVDALHFAAEMVCQEMSDRTNAPDRRDWARDLAKSLLMPLIDEQTRIVLRDNSQAPGDVGSF